MQTNIFNRMLGLIFLGLILIIAVLSWLLEVQGPRVRFIRYQPDLLEAGATKNKSLEVHFDRPLQQTDYTDQVTIEPAVTYTTRTTRQALVITFNENLHHSTEYKISVGPKITDLSGRIMDEVYSEVFTTLAPQFAFLQRTPGTESTDSVFIQRIGGEQELIYSAPEIVMYAINSNSAVVATKGEVEDSLIIIDLKSKQLTQVDLPDFTRVTGLDISPTGSMALATVNTGSSANNVSPSDSFENRILSLFLETGETAWIQSNQDTYMSALHVEFGAQNHFAIAQLPNQEFYIISPFNDFEPIFIGTYAVSSGFSKDGDFLAFRDLVGFTKYDINNSTSQLLPISSNTIGSLRLFKSGGFVSDTTYERSVPRSSVFWYKDFINQPALVWTGNPGKVLSAFDPSFDGMLLALTLGSPSCTYDQLSPNAQCEDIFTTIYDIQKAEKVAEFNGFDLTWVP